MKKLVLFAAGIVAVGMVGLGVWLWRDPAAASCLRMVAGGFPTIADHREDRFAGKADVAAGACRGGADYALIQKTPWVDWQSYWSAGDIQSLPKLTPPAHPLLGIMTQAGRGFMGALIDLERARIELVKFSLFDNLTHRDYALGRINEKTKAVIDGRELRVWPEMRLQPEDPLFPLLRVEQTTGAQLCHGEMIRFRTLTGVCNDIANPAMGSTGMPFGRNVQFGATFPDKQLTPEAASRHGGRIDLMTPDPQLVSRALFTRQQSDPAACNAGYGAGLNSGQAAHCDYQKADTLNVLAGFWIQFMTHDWFTHLDEGRNSDQLQTVGCAQGAAFGCNPAMQIEEALFAETGTPPTFVAGGREEMARSYKTTRNLVTAWWDASQVYGHDETSVGRVKRDPADPARLLLVEVPERTAKDDPDKYLPVLQICGEDSAPDCTPDPMNPKWAGQEAVGFPENWSIGTSFLHNVFVREHNIFVDKFRKHVAAHGSEDSGLRHPDRPGDAIRYNAVTDEEIFQIARLVVSAEIAKIHTTEWTTQLLYNEPLRTAMFSNWFGLSDGHPMLKHVLERIAEKMHGSPNPQLATSWYSAFAAGPGIVGSGTVDMPGNVADVAWANGGTNHFGVPFNFTEEFVSVYRLHTLVPDLIELRNLRADPNRITGTLPLVETFRGKATGAVHQIGLRDLALSFGRQRAGSLSLGNHPVFLQNLDLSDPASPGRRMDVAALDILRDRERGIPRFNEFRRQIGLRPLTSFDDFIDQRLLSKAAILNAADAATLAQQRALAATLRDIYGTHVCDSTKIISHAMKLPVPDQPGKTAFPDDCLGHPHGSVVDNVEDLDTVVGYLAESTRPHGFAISETQFQIFIINASRRLFSDRFFTSSFRPEFYSHFGLAWVENNGPERMMETQPVNGHVQEVAPMKRVLMRTIPELTPELAQVVNSFDPWARDRGTHYSTRWEPRPDAKADPAFAD